MVDRVLVTGSEGFIGSHLVEALVRRGRTVRALVRYDFQNRWGWIDALPADIRNEIEVVPSDICDPFSVLRAVDGCGVVFHLAALIAIPYSYLAPASYVETNVKGTLNVLQACLTAGVSRVINTSTSETYGTAQYVPIDESHPLVGQSPYAASKIGADKLAEAYHLSFGLPVVTVRPFNTFGPRQSARAVIPTVVIQALTGHEVHLGALDPVRDLTYVEDTAGGFIAASEHERAIGHVVNLGNGEGISIGDLASLILQICGSKAQIVVDEDRKRPDASEVRKLICDNRLARELLGWSPRVGLRSGLERTVDWMRNNLELYKPAMYTV